MNKLAQLWRIASHPRELALLKSSSAAVLSGHDCGNARFGVTRAVDEALGGVDEQCGMRWLKRAAR